VLGEVRDLTLPSLPLEGGGCLSPLRLRLAVWGELVPGREAVLVTHPLTADHAAARLRDQPERPGWWEGVVGEGRLLDPTRVPVVCMNTVGSCYGSTGPLDVAPDGLAYGSTFPGVTVRDMVRAQAMALEYLGVGRITVVGGSLGGMMALEWARLYPDRVRLAVAIGASHRLGPRALMWNAVQRRAIVEDPAFHPRVPGATPGLARAREIAMITYRGDGSLERQFGRRLLPGAHPLSLSAPAYEVESYLLHQGERLRARFDVHSYLVLLRAMDSHDLTAPVPGAPPPHRWAPVVYVGIRSDALFPASQVRHSAATARRWGQTVHYVHVDSDYGHDAFLVEQPLLAARLWPYLAPAVGSPPQPGPTGSPRAVASVAREDPLAFVAPPDRRWEGLA
jgi:homoserine O-acetyltransferase